MPRVATPKPVALATTPISAAIFVPSANEVIIFGRWPWPRANAFCVSGVRLVVEQALDVPAEDRPEAQQPDLVDEIHDDRRLVSGHVGQDHPGRHPRAS